MFKNYCTIIIRNLWRNKLYTLVNVIGLGVGIASLVWGFQNFRYGFSYDNFHKDNGKIYRVLTKFAGTEYLRGVCPATLATVAKNDFPNVKSIVRWESRGLNVKAVQSETFQSEAHFTDPAFFDLFNFPLVHGTINLNDRATVIITEKTAKKFFGDTDPIGKILTFYSDEKFRRPLTVTGILKDPPFNSSLRFDMITHTDNQLKEDGSVVKDDDWAWLSDAVFIKLSSPAEAANLSNSFKKYLPLQQSARQDVKLTTFALQPLAQVSDRTLIGSNALAGRPPASAIYSPFIL
ncbi:MAG TPA: ABC transporter permease, partial [Puia sp.]|nr:ABC transporter permease [Puia sp.]